MGGAAPDFILGLPPFIRNHTRSGRTGFKLGHMLYPMPPTRFPLLECQNSKFEIWYNQCGGFTMLLDRRNV